MQAPKPIFVSPVRISADKDGKVLKPGEPGKAFLVVAAGGTLPMPHAIALGIATPEGNPIEAFTPTTGTPNLSKAGKGKKPKAGSNSDAATTDAPKPSLPNEVSDSNELPTGDPEAEADMDEADADSEGDAENEAL